MKRSIKLLAVDLDGTVLDEQGGVREGVTRALGRLRAGGIACLAATGRRLSSARPMLEELELAGEAVIHNGAVVVAGPEGPAVWSRYLPPEACRKALEILRGKGLGSILYYDTHDSPDEILIEADSPDHEGYLRWYTGVVAGSYTVVEDLSRASHRRVTRIIAAGAPAVLREVRAWLSEHCSETARSMLVTDPAMGITRVEVLHPEADKWAGVCAVADRLGVPTEEVAAVGDDLNDLGMITGAGWGVAVANAHEELRAAADQVTVRPGPDGFLEMVDELLANG